MGSRLRVGSGKLSPATLAVLAGAPDAAMGADGGAPAVLADAPDAVMLADAHTSAVLAGRAFGELRNLKNLTLDNNEIEVLSPNTFQGLGKLERLYLDGNTESVHGQL